MVECSCEDLKELIREVIKEEFGKKIIELQASVSKPRKKSGWQTFLKECIPTKQELPFKERVKACSIEWKKKKKEAS